jgi:hypothetical protein
MEGPDWWGEDEVKRVTEAILSMKGNLIGFHSRHPPRAVAHALARRRPTDAPSPRAA